MNTTVALYQVKESGTLRIGEVTPVLTLELLVNMLHVLADFGDVDRGEEFYAEIIAPDGTFHLYGSDVGRSVDGRVGM